MSKECQLVTCEKFYIMQVNGAEEDKGNTKESDVSFSVCNTSKVRPCLLQESGETDSATWKYLSHCLIMPSISSGHIYISTNALGKRTQPKLEL